MKPGVGIKMSTGKHRSHNEPVYRTASWVPMEEVVGIVPVSWLVWAGVGSRRQVISRGHPGFVFGFPGKIDTWILRGYHGLLVLL